MDNNEDKKLKPVIFKQGGFSYNRFDDFKQRMLLKGLQVTVDPQKLKEMIGVKTVAEVYRTLDKLAMRKEYHEALARKGIDFDYLVGGIKNICDGERISYDTKLKALQVLLKSLGLDEYKESEINKEGWEDVLIKIMEEKKRDSIEIEDYEVNFPKENLDNNKLLSNNSNYFERDYI